MVWLDIIKLIWIDHVDEKVWIYTVFRRGHNILKKKNSYEHLG